MKVIETDGIVLKTMDFKEKDCVLVKATVAEHREYNSEPETYLNRVKILRNIGSK